MEMYYNHLTDKLEELEPFMAKTLPRSREEYLKRVEERSIRDSLNNNSLHEYKKEYPLFHGETFPTVGDEIAEEKTKTYKEAFGKENPLIKVAKDYLNEHPEEVIKLRDEGLVQEMVDFAAKQNAELDPNAFNGAPTEEEAYIEKREREGRPLTLWEETSKWHKDSVNKLKGSDLDIDNAKSPIEPSRYMMGNDPYGDADTKSYMYKKNEDGSVEYLKSPEDIITDGEYESSFEVIAKWIMIGIIGATLISMVWLALQ